MGHSLDTAPPFTVSSYADTPTQDIEFSDGGTISGHAVIDPSIPGDIYSEVEVFAYPVDSHNQAETLNDDPAEADVDLGTGDYTLDVAPGNYDIEYEAINTASDGHGNYYNQWYDNSSTAQRSTEVTVTGAGDNESLDDQVIGQGLTIAGTVTATGSGPVAGIDVDAVPSDGTTISTTTDGSGDYTMNVPPGVYTLEFHDPNGVYPDRFYDSSLDGTSNQDLATSIAQASGDYTADFDYDAYATLTVHVANKAGTSLSSVDGAAISMTDGAKTPNAAVLQGIAVDGKPGTYEISGLQQNQDYALSFNPFGTSLAGTYPQYYGGVPDYGTNPDIGDSELFTPTQASNSLDVTLASSASVSGVVTNTAHAKLKGIGVSLYGFDGSTWNYVTSTATSSTGAYSFPGVATGSYTVKFYSITASPYILGYAGGAAGPSDATAVYTTLGKPAVLNATLATGGSISGVVGALGGTPKLAHITITPMSLIGTPGNFIAAIPSNAAPVSTSTTGAFSLAGLPTGYYALSYNDAMGVYGDTFDNPAIDPGSTSPVYHVTAGHATVVSGVIGLPFLSDQETAQVAGSLDTSMAGVFDEAAGFVKVYDSNGKYVTQTAINVDGGFSLDLIPGVYSYSAYIFDPDNPQNVFASDNDTFSVSQGANDLTLPVVPEAQLAFTTAPQIAASSTDVGTTYSLNDVTWNHTGATVKYQWFRDTTPIYGATNSIYTSQGADLNADLTVRVTVSDVIGDDLGQHSFAESITGYATAADPVTASDSLYNTDPPTTTVVNGEASIGQVIHAQPGNWNNVPGATYTYQWVNDDGSMQVVGTGPTFIPTVAMYDEGISIRLYVTAVAPGYANPDPAPAADSFIMLPEATPVLKVAPVITSRTVGGNVFYTVTPGTWSIAHTTPQYQWGEPGVTPASTNTTTSTFEYQPALDGATTGVTVVVAATLDGHGPGEVRLTARKDTSPISAGSPPGVMDSATDAVVPSSSSPVTFGSVLTAGTSTLGYASDNSFATSFTFQWQHQIGATWVNIAGATHQTYTVGLADMNHNLQVIISGSSATHASEPYLAFAGVGALRTDLVDTPATITAAPTNTGDPTTKVVETVGAWGSTTAVTNSYQWYDCPSADDCSDPTDLTNFTAILPATTNTYIPTVAQAGDTLVLGVTGLKAGYESSTIESAPVVVGAEGVIQMVAPPAVTAGLSSGNAVYGTKLTAKSATFDISGITMSYDWQVSVDGNTWTDANGTRTGLTYTPALADMTGGNHYIRLAETATKTGYTLATSDSVSYPLVGAIPVPIVSPVVATFGNNWVANSGTWPTQDGPSILSGTVTYQWYVDNVLVDNETNSFDPTTVTAADSVSVTVTDPGDQAYQSASRTIIAQKGTAPTWNTPAVTGTPAYGNTLSAPTTVSDAYTYPDPSNPDAVLSYQWYEGSTAILHATSANYTPPTTYIGKLISVKITSTSPYYATAVDQTVGVPFTTGAAPHGSPTVSYTGSVHTGSTVGVALGTYPAGVVHSYQWQVSIDDVAWTSISGATKSTYVIPAAYLDYHIRAIVTTSKTGYTTAVDDTPAVSVNAPTVLAPIVAPTLSGTGAVGSVLTVSPGAWNVTGTTFTYQWFRDGAIIPGVTGTTYTPTGDELGEEISVNVTGHASGYYFAVVSPNVVSVTAGASPTVVSIPKITGTVASGSTLTVSQGVWSLDDLTVAYQWYNFNGGEPVPISGATSNTFTPDDSFIGATLFVLVQVSRPGYGTNQVNTSITSAVAAS